MVIGPAGSRAMGQGTLGPGPVLNVHACPLPVLKVCTSCWIKFNTEDSEIEITGPLVVPALLSSSVPSTPIPHTPAVTRQH